MDQIKIASPCTADWEQMQGDDRVRFCGECKKNVFNLSAMTRRDAEALLRETNGNLCTQLYRRTDGTVLTADCPVGFRVKMTRVRRRLGWAIAGAMGLSTAWAQDTATVSGSVRNSDGTMAAKTVVRIKGERSRVETITDERGAFSIAELEPGTYSLMVGENRSLSNQLQVKDGDAIEIVIQRAYMQVMGSVSELKRKPWWRRLI